MANVSRFTVRTSGRRTFRRCMRKWGWQSSMRKNLQRKGVETNIHFWFGSAIHFAMEDYFGYNRFGDLQRAFQGYYAAFPAYERPNGADEHYYLGLGMLDYFKEWYKSKNETYGFETVWLHPDHPEEVAPGTPGAEPLVEQSFILDLGKKVLAREDTDEIISETDPNLYQREDGSWYYVHYEEDLTLVEVSVIWKTVYYHGTFDRIVRDRQGRWWIMDWKTAKSADTGKLDTDDQISAYLWAAEQWFGRPIHGFMYVQLTKDLAKPLKRLANGHLSVDKKQKTTYRMARQSVIDRYGSVSKAPKNVVDYLNLLTTQETPEGDRFIRWDPIFRTKEQKISTYHHIMGELDLMANPNLYLFPNFTRDCSWDCQFRDACMALEQQNPELAQSLLDEEFEERPREEDGNIEAWRERIPWPDSPLGSAVGTLIEEMQMDADAMLNLILPDKYNDLVEERD